MCKTIEDSIFSGSLSWFTGIILILTGKPKYLWGGFFILVVGTMQWVDTAIWYFRSKGWSTDILTKRAVPIVLMMEIIVGYLGYVYYYGERMPWFEPVILLMIIYYLFVWPSRCGEATIAEDGYIQWCGGSDKTSTEKVLSYLSHTAIMLVLFFPFLFYPDIFMRNLIMAVGFILWLQTAGTDAFGSRWCHSFYVVDVFVLGKLALYG